MAPILYLHHGTVFKATTYYLDSLNTLHSTNLLRKSFFRIKHVYNFFIYQNISIEWSKSYLFFKKTFKSFLSYNLMRYNYIVNHSIFLTSSMEASTSALYPVKATLLTRYLNSFYQKTALKPFILPKLSSPAFYLLISSPVKLALPLKGVEDPLYLVSEPSLTPSFETNLNSLSYNWLLNVSFTV